METQTLFSQKTLRLTLYSGIALVVTSMLFLSRETAASPAFAQIALAVAAPAFFYLVGGMVYRTLNAPLAAPGIVATGAWLVAVELIHFYDQRDLLPDFASRYYWLLAALFAAALITLTGYRARIWLLIPLVPLAQINAIAAIMSATGLGIAWWPVFAFGLVLAWWEIPLRDDEWRLVYRVSAALFEVFLLVFSYWLPAQTANSMLITWATCALLVAILGARHGWVNLGPLAIALLALAAVWGLPAPWWPPVWLAIAIGTVIFIERLARRDDDTTLALEMSTALAALLSGFAALVAVGFPFFGVEPIPLITVTALIGSGGLMIWLGRRRELVTAEHAGLWLLAAAWAKIYFLGFGDGELYGLWLSLLAVIALLTERLLISATRIKRKSLSSIQEAVARWPMADLVVGLSVIIVIWLAVVALDLPATDPMIVAITLSVVIGVWIATGLVYRMPALLHVALWLAPLAYALLLVLTLPPLRSLCMLGLAWQVLALAYLLVGHALPRHRPAMLAPFFMAGYALLGVGLTILLGDTALAVVGLGLVIVVSFFTGIAVLVGAHPAWNALATWLIPPDERPYAHLHLRHIFLFLTAWLAAIWLFLMLGIAGFPVARQGIALVLLSTVWIVVGRVLPRLPDMVGWPVYAAGWFMWLIGLLQVFFSPTEAILTAIFGLALSAEALYRSKALHWMPVFILQILFSVLQVAWMLQISGYSFLLAVTLSIAMAGMVYERQRGDPAGRITALTGSLLSAAIWLAYLNPISTAGMIALALAALAVYRRWELLALAYGPIAVMALLFGFGSHWQYLMIAGGAQIMTGSALVTQSRPRRFRTVRRLLVEERDWATPQLWGGIVTASAGVITGWRLASNPADLTFPTLIVAAMLAVCASGLRIPRLPYAPLALVGMALFSRLAAIGDLGYYEVGDTILVFGTGMMAAALAFRLLSLFAVRRARPFPSARWLVWWVRPLLYASGFLAVTGFVLTLVPARLYSDAPGWFIANCVLFSLFSIAIFLKDRRPRWIALAIGAGWLAWFQLLIALDLRGLQWHTIPLGLLLLALARAVKGTNSRATELLAIDALLFGSATDIYRAGLVSWATVGLIAQLLALAAYGYRERRPAPLVSAVLVVIGGIAFALFMITPWLIPFAAGVALLAGAVLLEAHQERVGAWCAFWRQRLRV